MAQEFNEDQAAVGEHAQAMEEANELGNAAGLSGVLGAAVGAATGGPMGAAAGAAAGLAAGAAAEQLVERARHGHESPHAEHEHRWAGNACAECGAPRPS